MLRFFSTKGRRLDKSTPSTQAAIDRIKNRKNTKKEQETNPWSPPWLKSSEIRREEAKHRAAKAPVKKSPKELSQENNAPSPSTPQQNSPPSFSCDPSKTDFTPADLEKPNVPLLANGIDRALFNPGVQFVKDSRTNVYNFTPKIENIMSIKDFDFNCVPKYIPSSADTLLADRASELGKLFTGSTSSLTPLLFHFHMALSHNRPPQIMNLSKFFPGKLTTFTNTQRSPASFFLKYHPNSKIYSVGKDDSDSEDILLSLLGQSMEKMLVTDADVFTMFDKTKSHLLTEEQKADANAYHYSACADFLMRSQLDCYDPRLPGTGMFDLKTRAVCAVRFDIDYAQIHDGSHYQLNKREGLFESFAREHFELIRSTLFKYSLQARIGRMDGIFVAYHNINTLFGFEYFPLSEIDKIYHTGHLVMKHPGKKDLDDEMSKVAGYIANNEFKLSMDMLSKLFKYALKRVPNSCANESLNMVLHSPQPAELVLFIKPMLSEHIGRAPAELAQNDSYIEHQDPASLIQHWNSNPGFIPPDLLGYRIKLDTFIAGKFVPPTVPPSISPGDAWNVNVKIEELKGDQLQEMYKRTMKHYRSQVVTSVPLTERIEDEEELRRVALAKLPSPSALQETLRKLGEKGRQYKMWDLGRDKIWKTPE